MSERVARLLIELQELEPKIWRRIDMSLSTTLEALHEAIQMTMGCGSSRTSGNSTSTAAAAAILRSGSSMTSCGSTRRKACGWAS